MKRSPFRVFVAACIVVAGHLIVLGILTSGMTDQRASHRDFIAFWSIGQQLIHGGNPYDLKAVALLERSVGHDDNQRFLPMREPPWAFFMVLPLGLVSPTTGLILWLLVLLAALSASIWLLWLVNGSPDNRFHLLGYAFAPFIACLMAGQFGIILLLGIALFLRFHQSRPALAGAALLLCALKPHLFIPLGLVLLLWALHRKAYRVLAGFSAALLASCLFSYYLDPHAWSQYSLMMRVGGAANEPTPTLSVTLRFLIHRNAVWLQFLPLAAACVWGAWYFWTRRLQWNWLEHGMLVLLVSGLCTPFGWLTDESMLFPAVLAGLYAAANSRRSFIPIALIGAAALIELFAQIPLTSPYYQWTAPAWLAWYLYATRRKAAQSGKNTDNTAIAEMQ